MSVQTGVRICLAWMICISFNALGSLYPTTQDIQQQIINEAKRQQVSPSLALAIAKVESDFNPHALSHAGAKGIMQIMPKTAEQSFGISSSQLYNPQVNIWLGIAFIKRLIDRYDGRIDIALSHYNGGSNVKSPNGHLSVIPATQGYVKKVLATRRSYQHYDVQPSHRGATTSSETARSGIAYTKLNNELPSVESDIHSQNPQIEALRALRLHNITRNYKTKSEHFLATKNQTPKGNSFRSDNTQSDINSRIKNVRQWESIYPP